MKQYSQVSLLLPLFVVGAPLKFSTVTTDTEVAKKYYSAVVVEKSIYMTPFNANSVGVVTPEAEFSAISTGLTVDAKMVLPLSSTTNLHDPSRVNNVGVVDTATVPLKRLKQISMIISTSEHIKSLMMWSSLLTTRST